MGSLRFDTVIFAVLAVLLKCGLVLAGNKFGHSRDSGNWAAKLGSSNFPSYLPTTLLKDKGKTESRLPEPLLQTAMTYYQTRPENIDDGMLMTTLGSHYNAQWMSIHRPVENVNNVEVVHDYNEIPSGLLSDLQGQNFTYVDERGALVTIKPPVQKILEKWLLQKASCPVHYQWTDIGPLYWPRWIRIGSCSGESHCSWPPGMLCVATQRPMTVRILRWHCRPRRRNKPAKRNNHDNARGGKNRNRKQKNKQDTMFRVKCRWRKVRYPITTKCACTC